MVYQGYAYNAALISSSEDHTKITLHPSNNDISIGGGISGGVYRKRSSDSRLPQVRYSKVR